MSLHDTLYRAKSIIDDNMIPKSAQVTKGQEKIAANVKLSSMQIYGWKVKPTRT